MTQPVAEHIAVLGAGVVGAATSLALQKDGHRVTLVDRAEPGMGASFGNAGFIHTGGNIPLASPGVVRASIKMMFDAEAPLVIRWRYLPGMLPWIRRFAKRSKPDAFMADAQALNELTSRSVPAWKALAAASQTENYFGARGELYLFRSRATFEASRAEFDMRRDLGVDVQEITADEIRQMEPGVTREAQHGWYLADSMFVKSPYQLTRSLTAKVIANGGRLKNLDVAQITPTEQGRAVDQRGRRDAGGGPASLSPPGRSRRILHTKSAPACRCIPCAATTSCWRPMPPTSRVR